jgi:hypothetical protein
MQTRTGAAKRRSRVPPQQIEASMTPVCREDKFLFKVRLLSPHAGAIHVVLLHDTTAQVLQGDMQQAQGNERKAEEAGGTPDENTHHVSLPDYSTAGQKGSRFVG